MALVLERLEPRVLLSSNPIDLAGQLRFVPVGDWENPQAGVYESETGGTIGLVPQGSEPFIPMLDVLGGMEVNTSTAKFQITTKTGEKSFLDYRPNDQVVPYGDDIFIFQQDSGWLDAATVVTDGLTLEGTMLDPNITGLPVPGSGGTILPNWFQLAFDNGEPLLKVRGSVGVSILSQFGSGKISKLLHGLNLDMGSNDTYTVTADKNQLVKLEKKDGAGGGWISVTADPFKLGGFSAQPQLVQFSWDPDDDKFLFVGDVVLTWTPKGDDGLEFGGETSQIILDLGNASQPGLTLKDNEIWEIDAAIGVDSKFHVAGSEFSISNAGFSYDRESEEFGVGGEVLWTFGDHNELHVKIGEPAEPGLVIREGEVFHFEGDVTAGSLNVKALELDVQEVTIAYDRYKYEGEEISQDPPSPPGDGLSIADISDQYYHPETDVTDILIDVSGVDAQAQLTVTADSSNDTFLPDSDLTITPGENPLEYTLSIPETSDETGTTEITVTVSHGSDDAEAEFHFTVGTVEIEYSGTAWLNIGHGPKFEIGVVHDHPWTWIQQPDGHFDWHVGSLTVGINGKFGLGPLEIEAKNLAITFVDDNGSTEWDVSGGAAFPALWNAAVTFGNQANPGLTIIDGAWSVHDVKVSLEPTHYFGSFGLEQLIVHYTQVSGEVDLTVAGALGFPGGFSIGAGFEFEDYKLEMIEVDYQITEGEGIPIADSGLFITGMKGELDDIESKDITFRGDIWVAAGPSFHIRGKDIAFLTGHGDFWINRKGMEIEADVEMLGSKYFGYGSASLILDWNAGVYGGTIDVSMLDDFVEFSAWFELAHHRFIVGGKAEVKIPDAIPLIGGKELAEVDFLLKVTPDDSFVAAWTHIDIPLIVTTVRVWVGAEYDFTDHHFRVIGHGTIKKLKGEMPDPGHHTYKITHAFDVPATANGGSFEATWSHYDSSVRVYLLPPGWKTPVHITSAANGGTISDPAETSAPKYILWSVPDRTTPTSLAFMLRPEHWSESNPAVQMPTGKYNVSVMSNNEVWPDIDGQSVQPIPTLDLTLQNVDRNTEQVGYGWKSASPDKTKIELYYDDDRYGHDGKKFATIDNLPDDGYYQHHTGNTTWGFPDVAELPPTPHYVYGLIDDGTSVPVYSEYTTNYIIPHPPVAAAVEVSDGTEKNLPREIPNWAVLLLDDDNNIVKDVEGFPCKHQTNQAGEVGFNPPAGTYTLLTTLKSPGYEAVLGNNQTLDPNGGIRQSITVTDPEKETVSVTCSFKKLSEIQGRIFHDLEADGKRDIYDPSVTGWTAYVDSNNNSHLDDGEPTSVTDSDGYHFFFEPPDPGHTDTYVIRHIVPEGFSLEKPSTGSYTVELTTPETGVVPSSYGNDFLDAETTVVTGLVFDDLDGDGFQDPAEPPLPNLTVTLKKTSDGSTTTGTTDAAGRYSISTVLPAEGADYTIAVTPPGGASITWPVSHVFEFGQMYQPTSGTWFDAKPLTPGYTDAAVADFDGDGYEDAAVLTVEEIWGGQIYPLIYDPSAGIHQFILEASTWVDHSARHKGVQLLGANLDSDARAELVVVEETGYFQIMKFSDPDYAFKKTFRSGAAITGGALARMTATDLDGDGHVDLFANDGYGWMNNGSGSFTRTDTILIPGGIEVAEHTVMAPAVGHFADREGSLALAYMNTGGTAMVSTLKKVAPNVASFIHVQDLGLDGDAVLQIAAGDLDADGDTDLVVAASAETHSGKQVLMHILFNDEGTLWLNQTFEFDNQDNLGALMIGDMDQNGLNDIVWAFPKEVNVLLNHGRNYFVLGQQSDYNPDPHNYPESADDYPLAFPVPFSDGSAQIGVAFAAKLNTSSEFDVLYATVYAPTSQIHHEYMVDLIGTGKHTGYHFGLHNGTAPAGQTITGMVFEDLNENNIQDLGEWGLPDATVHLLDAQGQTVLDTATTDAAGGFSFDNPPHASYRLHLAQNNWTQTTPYTKHLAFGAVDSFPGVADIDIASVADFDGDGIGDVALIVPGKVVVQLGQSGGGNPQSVVTDLSGLTPPLPKTNVIYIQAEDLDADGDRDIVLSLPNDDGWKSRLIVLTNNGDATFTAAQNGTAESLNILVYGSMSIMGVPRLSDVDADGYEDLLWFEMDDPRVYILLNAGDGTFKSLGTDGKIDIHTPSQQMNPFSIPDLTDLNLDGQPDMVVVDDHQNELVFLRGYGQGKFSAYATAPISFVPGRMNRLDANGDHSIRLTDLDADGLPDILVASADGVEVLWNKGGFEFDPQTVLHAADLPGGLNDIISVVVEARDYAGDGNDDLLVLYCGYKQGDYTGETLLTWLPNEGAHRFGSPDPNPISMTGTAGAVVNAADMTGDGLDEFVLVPQAGSSSGDVEHASIWPCEAWLEDYFSATYSGDPLGGYNFGVLEPAGSQSNVSGTVFYDKNKDGAWQSGESGISDVTVYADLNKNKTLDPGEPGDTTDLYGLFDIKGLPAGKYAISQVAPFPETTPDPVYIKTEPGQTFYGVSFGEYVSHPDNKPPSPGFGGAIDLDGVSNYVEMIPSLNKVSDWTFEAWVKPTAADSGFIYSEGDPKETLHVEITHDQRVHVSAWNVHLTNNWKSFETPAGKVKLNEWNYVAVTLSGGGVGTGSGTIYVNDTSYTGTLQKEDNDNTTYAAIGANVGGTHGGGQGLDPFTGQIDEVRVWNTARSENNIKENMDKTLAGNEAYLVGYWRMDDGSGETARDAAGGDNNGTVEGESGYWTASTIPLAYTIDEDGSLSGTLFGADPESDPIEFKIDQYPVGGALSLNPYSGLFGYTPSPDWNGQDSFTFKVSDDAGAWWSDDSYSVAVTVNSVNDPPDAVDDSYQGKLSETLTGNVLTNDSDFHHDAPNENNLPLTAQLVSDVERGTLTLNQDGSFTYKPLFSPFGNHDQFTYHAIDSLGGVSNLATVSITVSVALAHGQQCIYHDLDDTKVKLKIKHGEAELFFDNNNLTLEPLGRNGRRGFEIIGGTRLIALNLPEATEKTRVSFRTRGGADGMTEIEGVTAATRLGKFNAPRVSVVGSGMDFARGVDYLKLAGFHHTTAHFGGNVGTLICKNMINSKVIIEGNVNRKISVRKYYENAKIGVGVLPGSDGKYFTADDITTVAGTVGRLMIHRYDPQNSNDPHGILARNILSRSIRIGRDNLTESDMPFQHGDFNIILL